jgi:hypothetical protein
MGAGEPASWAPAWPAPSLPRGPDVLLGLLALSPPPRTPEFLGPVWGVNAPERPARAWSFSFLYIAWLDV